MHNEKLNESVIIMLDDNIDEIFITRRIVRGVGLVNRFISEQNSENLIQTLDKQVQLGVNKESFIVLLDINMPRIDGFEVLKTIRSHTSYSSVPVFMLSASDDCEDREKSEELGSNGFLVKPFNQDQFFNALKNVPTIKQQLMQ